MFSANFLKWALITEAVLLSGVYMLSPYGVQAVNALRHECAQTRNGVERLRAEVLALDREIVQWQTEPFYKEKVAREQLQMARRGDVIYYVAKK